ncbi:MAG: type VI secretion system tip protein VgrG [Methylotetracoccus sp.]
MPYARLRIADGDSARGDFGRSSGEFFVPGRKLTLLAGYHGETQPLFEGRVLNQRLMVRNGASWLEVECRDAAFAMTLERRNRYFADKNDADIVSELIGEYSNVGVSAGQAATTSTQHPQLLQYQTSDWDFMIARLEAAGLVCFVDAGVITTLKPSLDDEALAELSYGGTVLELDADLDARSQTGGVRAVAWDPAGQALVEVTATDPGWAGNGNLTASELSAASTRTEDLVWHGGSLASDALQSWADSTLLRARMAATRGRVRFRGLSGVTPGKVLELSRFSDRFNGKVYVTGVRHEFTGNSWVTDAEFGMTREPHAARGDVSHLPAAGLAAAVHGLQIGIVTELSDDPGKEHRVRVKVPLAGMDEKGMWARVATLDAGKGDGDKPRGTFFRPEKDDEVVLGFFHDDPGQPVILGMLHSSKLAPPVEATADNDKKAYHSRSGIQLEFDDKKKAVTIATPGGQSLVIDDEAGSIVLTDKNGNTLTLGADGIKLASSQKAVEIEAKKDFKAKGMNVEFDAQTGFKAKSQAQAEVSTSGKLTLKGSIVMIN